MLRTLKWHIAQERALECAGNVTKCVQELYIWHDGYVALDKGMDVPLANTGDTHCMVIRCS